MEIHVRKIAMLCDMKTNPDSGRIAILNLEVDIAHRGVESAGIRVGNCIVGWNNSLLQPWTSAARRRVASTGRGSSAGEDYHVANSFLKAGSILAKNNDWSVLAISNQSDSRPDDKSLADAIVSFGDEDNPLNSSLLNFIDGSLNSVGVISDSVTMKRRTVPRQVNGL